MTQANITIEDIPVSTGNVAAKIVKFQGQLDESNVDEKAKLIYNLLEENPQSLYLLFDFEELEYMNSKSIGYLTDWYGKVTEGGGKIAIAKTRSNILDILQVVGLTQLINCYATLDEAKLALLQQPQGETAEEAPSTEQSAAEPAPTPAPEPEMSVEVPSTEAPTPEVSQESPSVETPQPEVQQETPAPAPQAEATPEVAPAPAPTPEPSSETEQPTQTPPANPEENQAGS